MKTHGDKKWERYPSYFGIFIPYILQVLRDLDLRITFFIVGQDAAIIENRKYLEMIVRDGHDIGNHSFNHEVWINQLDRQKLEEEFDKAEYAILTATGKKTTGFRGPGFSWNKTMLELLHDRDYLYDASTLPTFIGPLARVYYFRRSVFRKEEKSKRSNLFGPLTEGFRKLKPYFFKIGNGKKILEIPITTMPFIRIPFHMSYLIYLNSFSPFLMRLYLKTALFLCRITSTPVSFLLHPLDVIGGDKVADLAFFPGMDISSKEKIKIFSYVMGVLKNRYNIVDMNTYAQIFVSGRKNTDG
jgi:hypothetical protein